MSSIDTKDSNNFLVLSWKPTRGMFTQWRGYLWGSLMVAAVTVLGYFFRSVFSTENILALYLMSVVISSIYFGLGPSIYISVLIIVVMDFLFIEPIMAFYPIKTQDFITLAILLVISIMISYLASRFRQKTAEAQRREREANTLYELNRVLAKSNELDSSIKTVIKMGKDIFGFHVAIFLPDYLKKKELIPYTDDPDFAGDSREAAIANWCFEKRQPAGVGTNNFSSSIARYLPLMTPRETIGVISLWNDQKKNMSVSNEDRRLLRTFTDLTAVALESIKLAEEVQKAVMLKAKEKLQTAVLNSISHDLRTPLVSVIGVLSSLQEESMNLDEASRKNLIQVAREDAERLNRFIANMLDSSRIEAGDMKILKQPSDTADLIGVALEQLGKRTAKHHIEIDVPAELPFVNVDFNLIVQTLVNILDNALKYSPEGSSIEISARQIGEFIDLEFADHGIGIPKQDLPYIFDKFYHVQRQTNIPGIGLGLSICKGIIEAHGGTILAENRLGGGTIIKLKLPAV